MAHDIKLIICVCGGGEGGGRGVGEKWTGVVIHLFQTLCVSGRGVGEGDWEGDSLISNCIEKSSQ